MTIAAWTSCNLSAIIVQQRHMIQQLYFTNSMYRGKNVFEEYTSQHSQNTDTGPKGLLEKSWISQIAISLVMFQ